MLKHVLRLALTPATAAVLGMLALTGGCMDPVSDSQERMQMVSEAFPRAVGIYDISASRGAQSSLRPGGAEISEIRGASGLLGYCVETEVRGRSGPFRIRVLMNPQLVVVRAAVISYPWSRGRDVSRSEFTDQFRGKGPDDSIVIGDDIDAMSGATISCNAMADGISETLKLLEELKSNSSLSQQK